MPQQIKISSSSSAKYMMRRNKFIKCFVNIKCSIHIHITHIIYEKHKRNDAGNIEEQEPQNQIKARKSKKAQQ